MHVGVGPLESVLWLRPFGKGRIADVLGQMSSGNGPSASALRGRSFRRRHVYKSLSTKVDRRKLGDKGRLATVLWQRPFGEGAYAKALRASCFGTVNSTKVH